MTIYLTVCDKRVFCEFSKRQHRVQCLLILNYINIYNFIKILYNYVIIYIVLLILFTLIL